MKSIHNILLVLTIVTIVSCDDMLLYDEPANTPVSNFDHLWNDFDKLYGGFIIKNINWDSAYDVYRPTITENSTDEELYNALTGMLGVLNDNHVFLLPDASTHLKSFNSGIIGRLEKFSDFKKSVVINNYLMEIKKDTEHFSYGKLTDDIGYIHMNIFDESEKYYEKEFNEIFDYLKDTKGLIFDIRNHEGGTDQLSMYVAGRFSTKTKKIFNFRIRNGASHNDFTETYWYSVKPEGKSQYTKKTVLLTHRFCISAAETFTIAMASLNNVTIVGDTTSGAFSDYVRRELPNGWGYGISVGEWRDSEGKSFEGIGFPPDITVQNDSADVANGIDKVLETAMQLFN